jgi:hypothetical protein
VLIELTIIVTDCVRSSKLANSLLILTRKLESAMESRLSRLTREFGQPLAQKLSMLAQRLGNLSAKNWALDSGFATYLATIYLNNSDWAIT